MNKASTAAAYCANLPEPQRTIVTLLTELIRGAAGDLDESIKWAQPVFSRRGPCMYINAHPRYVTFGFWRGAELDDPAGLLEGVGAKMRHVKLREVDDFNADRLAPLVVQAVALNERLGDPTARKDDR